MRRLGRALLGIIGFGIVLSFFGAAIRRSMEDVTLVFRHAPLSIVPAGHLTQVELVKRHLSKNETIFYVMEQFEPWYSRMWERSMFPDNFVLFVEVSQLETPAFLAMKSQYHVRYAVSAGKTPATQFLESPIILPPFPTGIPTVFGELIR